MRYTIFLLFWIFVILVICDRNVYSANKKKEKPNIIFFLADDLGWADLPVYGNKFNEAPNLNKLAEEGMIFKNAYAACPVCSPTRASIMSGQYPARMGIIDFIPGHWRPYEKVTVPVNRTQYLPREIITVAEILKQAGYKTGYFGKWHLGQNKEHHPSTQGFDSANTGNGFYNVKITPLREQGKEKRGSEWITDFGIDFIEENQDNPFFLFISYFDVHVQLDADIDLINKYLEKEKEKMTGYPCNAIYAAMLEHIDKGIGRIEQKLEESGLALNTIIIFFSDNGGLVQRFDKIPLIAKGKQHIYENSSLMYIASSNLPLRGEKGSLYEGGIREPMIVKWPGYVQQGTISEALVSSVDFLPTFADLAGVDLPQTQVFDGVSLVDVFTGRTALQNRSIFWHYPVYHHDVPKSAVRKGDWKLIHNLVDDSYSLYDLEVDIGEQADLSELFPNKKEEMVNILNKWRKDTGARLPEENPDFDETKREEWGVHPDRR
jgi:arylsulfatase A